ncbi:MAG: hypothetical protein WCI21_06665 [Alphaproteobacteria bacterium]
MGFLRHGHFRWFIVAVLLCAAAVWGYLRFEPDPPSGGSWYGYGLGTVAALMILWLAWLGVRKRSITPGTWTLKGWVSAHVYLGLALALIATLHTAFQFGWNLHTLFYGLMLLVIASGLVGVVLYVAIPRVLSANRAELTERQMLEQIEAFDQQLHEAVLPLSSEAAEAVRGSIRHSPIGGFHGRCGTARAIRIIARLQRGPAPDPQLTPVAALLAKKSEALARARRHARIKALLQAWLYIHVPATFAVLAAMVAHIVAVFFYS